MGRCSRGCAYGRRLSVHLRVAARDGHRQAVARYPAVTIRRGGRPGGLRTSAKQLVAERVRNLETRVVEGDPAKALLEVAGTNPANVIVVGNRGLGVADGQLLGSVPGDVAKNAVCDVLIVRTGEQTAPR